MSSEYCSLFNTDLLYYVNLTLTINIQIKHFLKYVKEVITPSTKLRFSVLSPQRSTPVTDSFILFSRHKSTKTTFNVKSHLLQTPIDHWAGGQPAPTKANATKPSTLDHSLYNHNNLVSLPKFQSMFTHIKANFQQPIFGTSGQLILVSAQ